MARRSLAAFLAALTLVLASLVFAPGLHHAIHEAAVADPLATDHHPGADENGHSHPASVPGDPHFAHVCAITLFAQGIPFVDPAPCLDPLARVVLAEIHPVDFVGSDFGAFRLRPARGPPASC